MNQWLTAWNNCSDDILLCPKSMAGYPSTGKTQTKYYPNMETLSLVHLVLAFYAFMQIRVCREAQLSLKFFLAAKA